MIQSKHISTRTQSGKLPSIQPWKYISWTLSVLWVRTCVGENFQKVLRIVNDIAYSETGGHLRVTYQESRQINWTDWNMWRISVKFVPCAGNFVCCGTDQVPQLPYHFDLFSCDLFSFSRVKSHLRWWTFHDIPEIQDTLTSSYILFHTVRSNELANGGRNAEAVT